MRTLDMWSLVIRIKSNYAFKGKRVHNMIFDILNKGVISGSTMCTGVSG